MRTPATRKALIAAIILNAFGTLECVAAVLTCDTSFAKTAIWLNLSVGLLLVEYVLEKLHDIKK